MTLELTELFLFLKGIGVGFAIAAPLGPVGVLCIQRSLTKGMLYGLASGLGAALADAAFGAVAAFGVSFVAQFLARQQFWFQLGGAAILLVMGLHGLFAKRQTPGAKPGANTLANDFFTTFMLAITNPITIFSLTAVFVAVGITTGTDTLAGGALVTGGVGLGSALWWMILCSVTSIFHRAISHSNLHWIRRISGLVMLSFCAGVLIHIFL